MNRRAALAVFAGAAAARGENQYHRYSRCLPDYLEYLAKQALDKRNAALASIRTPDAFKARQRWARETFWQLLGGEPERTALNPKVTGGFDRPAWRLEKLVYE